jgi:5-(carboxyamino)imidazole ribonucleotide mutase
MGSKSDEEKVKPALEILDRMGVEAVVRVLSAHRTPEKVRNFVLQAPAEGVEVFIAAAGKAAHLPGVVASWTTLPVIGIPVSSPPLGGLDALFSIVQMPRGVPVAAVGVDGSANAALLACSILSLKYPEVGKALRAFREELAGG